MVYKLSKIYYQIHPCLHYGKYPVLSGKIAGFRAMQSFILFIFACLNIIKKTYEEKIISSLNKYSFYFFDSSQEFNKKSRD